MTDRKSWIIIVCVLVIGFTVLAVKTEGLPSKPYHTLGKGPL